MRCKCPCCGNYTLYDACANAVCHVCCWHDHVMNRSDSEHCGGINAVSLSQARDNYKAFGACAKALIGHASPPSPEELPRNNRLNKWRNYFRRIGDVIRYNKHDLTHPLAQTKGRVQGVKAEIDCGPYFFYMKHTCPECRAVLSRRKREKVVNSESEEAKNYDFSLDDMSLQGNVRFVTYYFACPDCQVSYEIRELKRLEKEEKQYARQQQRAARRIARRAKGRGKEKK